MQSATSVSRLGNLASPADRPSRGERIAARAPAARVLAASVLAAALAACGGGGGGGGGSTAGDSGSVPSNPTPTGFPASGIYALDVTAQGPVGSPKFGLSLIHATAADTEFVIEPSTAGISDAVVVSSGTVNGTTAKVTSIQPYAAVYIVAGDVRRVPLVANGTAPASRVQKAGSTGACTFLVRANDYAAPDQSRYIVSTAGADGTCGTADDGQAEVTLNASGGVSVAAVAGPKRLGVLRDVNTLAPRGWFATDSVIYWSPAASIPTRAALDSVVLATYRSTLAEVGGALSVFDFPATTFFTEIRLDAALTAGTGWQPIGFDATSYYVYRNSGSTPAASTWSVLKIDRGTAAVTSLATGNGMLSSAGMGTSLLYATETGASNYRLLAFAKTVAGTPQVLQSSSTTIATMTTGSNGVHQVWHRPASGTGAYTVQIVNEAGINILTSVGGYPLAQPDPVALDFTTSENRTAFVFATGYGAAGFSGATLQAYDTALSNSVTLGTLPGASRYGADPVSVGVTAMPSSFLAGFAGRVTNGDLQASDAVAFSFDIKTAGSLKLATTRQ